jgi:hypothetical protein
MDPTFGRVVARAMGYGALVGAVVAGIVVVGVGMVLTVVEALRGVGGSGMALLPTLLIGLVIGGLAGTASGAVAGSAAWVVASRSLRASRWAVVAVAGPSAAVMVLLAYVGLYGGGSMAGPRWTAAIVALLAGAAAGTAGWLLAPRLREPMR